MPIWVWVLICAAAVLAFAVAVWAVAARRRTSALRDQFGQEYDRTVEEASSRRSAEAELRARQERREQLDIRPLPADARTRYLEQWRLVQAQFVDDPVTAVRSADLLVNAVMRDRGYPVDDFERRAADLSVDHPDVVEQYREAHRTTERSADGEASTENLRASMQQLRTLFDTLVSTVGDTRDRRVA